MALKRPLQAVFARIRRDKTNRTAASRRVLAEGGNLSWEAFKNGTGKTRAEYIRLLLRAHGGRLKQKDLTEMSGMSKATVCRWLNDLEAKGTITRICIGRENVVCLAAEEALP